MVHFIKRQIQQSLLYKENKLLFWRVKVKFFSLSSINFFEIFQYFSLLGTSKNPLFLL